MNNELNHPPNFEGLVLGCMDSYDSDQRLILKGIERSTRLAFLCTAQTSKFQQKSVKLFARMTNEFCFRFFRVLSDESFLCQISMNFYRNSAVIFMPNFDDFFSEFRRQLDKMAEFVESREFGKSHNCFGENSKLWKTGIFTFSLFSLIFPFFNDFFEASPLKKILE